MNERGNQVDSRLWMPFMAPFYDRLAQPFGWLAFRCVIGGHLVIEGWPKIQAPFAQAGFVEGLGFYPGWLFSPLLATVQFIGGFMIIAGLFTRPIALANAAMLLVTLIFHIAYPYGDAFLTAEGAEFLARTPGLLTPEGQQQLLADGGRAFLHQVQSKAVFNSTFWSASAALIAAYGGGALSVDRRLIRHEF